MSPVDDVQVHYSEVVPAGVFYLMPRLSSAYPDSIRFEPDPWPSTPLTFTDYAERERDRGLRWLADRLDDLCETWGMDPQKVWRDPKHSEQRRDGHIRFMVHERVALSVVRPDEAIVLGGVL